MAAVLRRGEYEVVESDIDREDEKDSVDFLTCTEMAPGTRSIITNPPYHIGAEFVKRALDLALPVGGMVAMLLRHEYDCAKKRRPLFEQPAFRIKLTMTQRPHWMENTGNSPRHNFAWFVWDAEHAGPASLGWLP